MARPASTVADERLGRYGERFRRFFGAPFRRRTYLNLAYLLLAFPLGIAYFALAIVGVVGLFLSFFVVGLFLLAGVFLAGIVLAGLERRLTARLLDVDLKPRTELSGDRRLAKLRSLLTDPKTWTGLCYLPVKFMLGLAAFVLVVTGLSTATSMLLVPFYYDAPGLYVGLVPDRAPEFHPSLYIGWNYLLVGFETVLTVGSWRITTLPRALLVGAGGIGLFLTILHLLNGMAGLWRRFARLMLAESYDPIAVIQRDD